MTMNGKNKYDNEWKKQNIKKMIELYNKGYSCITIGKMFKISPSFTCRLLKENGLTLHRGGYSILEKKIIEKRRNNE